MAIASDVALLSEVRRVLPLLRNVARHPAGADGLARAIGPYFAIYPQPIRSEEEWAAWWTAYAQILSDLPEAAISAGMLAWSKRPDAQFMPSPGQLLDIARHVPTPAGQAYARASAAAQLADNPARSPAEPLRPIEAPQMREVKTQETRDWARAEAARFRAESAARSKAIREETTPNLPPAHGELAPGRHVTPEMVALMARNNTPLAPVEQRVDEAA